MYSINAVFDPNTGMGTPEIAQLASDLANPKKTRQRLFRLGMAQLWLRHVFWLQRL